MALPVRPQGYSIPSHLHINDHDHGHECANITDKKLIDESVKHMNDATRVLACVCIA
jgi:hypothetical protein